jgi:signal transduction histidine kinase
MKSIYLNSQDLKFNLMKQESIQEALGKPLALLDGFLHPSLENDVETARRGRLQIRFGVLGGAIAIVYSTFFFAIEHFWGGCIVAISGLAIMQLPWIVKKTGNLTLAGNLYGAVLLTGLAGLCSVGGGLQGYANAWLASVPVCALLLMNLRGALIWSAISFATVVGFAALDMAGVEFFRTYESRWEPSIEAVSHIGLLVFLSLLGLLFEQTRIEAFGRIREANAKLSEANKELSDLNKQKNEFLNIAAHDLKNPLTIICGYADLLRELESPTLKQIQEQSAEILRSGNHMLGIIRNILNVRAIEDGEMRFNKERCCTQEVIQDLLTAYAPAARKKKIKLIFPPSEEQTDAWADNGAFQQITDNLVSNAIKYTPCGGTVTIRQSISEDDLVIEVMDTGPGLSKDDQSQLWTKFARMTPRPTGGETSNGLGLWIVRRLAEEMDGGAFCRSAIGQGSIFGVSLPLWMNQEETIADLHTSSADGAVESAFDCLIRGTELAQTKTRKTDKDDVALPG